MRKRTKRKVQGLHLLVIQGYYNEFIRKSREIKIGAFLMSDGADASNLLSELMVIIGTSCQAGAYQFGMVDWVQELHGALDTIAEMCNDDFKWQSEHAGYLCDACQLAEENLTGLKPFEFAKAYLDSESVAWEIREKKWRKESIASL